jgi:hypothetical protein
MNEIWAYIRNDGRVLADSTFRDEDDAWRIALGWPHQSEIEHAKAAGDRVVRVRVEVVGGEVGK